MRFFIPIFIICMLTLSVGYPQWEPDVRLTNDSAASCLSTNSGWCVATNGIMVHVVWEESRDGNWEIYYKRSTDVGVTWGSDIRLTNNLAYSYLPSVAVSGSVVHVVWRDDRDSSIEVYYKRSTDDGTTWGEDVRLTEGARIFQGVSAAVCGSVVHVAWDDLRGGNEEIYYLRSTDGGVTWDGEVRMTNDSNFSFGPSVAASGSVVNLMWDDRSNDQGVHYRRSTDGGATWSLEARLTDSIDGYIPSVAMSGDLVHVAWQTYFAGNWVIGYKRSTDDGTTWGPDTRLNDSGYVYNHLSTAASGNTVHIVWPDGLDPIVLYCVRSTDDGATWSADTGLTSVDGDAFAPSVAAGGGAVHVVWRDNRDGVFDIYYKRDPTGAVIGIDEAVSGVGERMKVGSTILRGMLNLQSGIFDLKSEITLLDITGRKVADLKVGANDIRHLRPGVYFIRQKENNLTRKVVVIR